MKDKNNIYVPMKGKKIGTLVSQPKVTEKFIEEWNQTLLVGYKLVDIHGNKNYNSALKQMLKEAGVEVGGK